MIQYHGATNDGQPLIADSHIYTLPSYYEGMPRTMLEFIAIGPSELASIQFVRDSNAGVIFDMEKSDELVGCIRNMICKRSRLEWLGTNDRVLATSVFEGEPQRKRFRQLILETIQKHHRRK